MGFEFFIMIFLVAHFVIGFVFDIVATVESCGTDESNIFPHEYLWKLIGSLFVSTFVFTGIALFKGGL